MGAFEDRLAEGYRQAANTPAKMPQPTTPTGKLLCAMACGEDAEPIQPDDWFGHILAIEQEAAAAVDRLARALYVALRDTDTTQFYGSDSPMDDFSEAVLQALLAALPPGWRLVGPDDVTVTVDGLTSALDHLGPVWDRVMDPDSDMSNAEFAAAILAALSADKEGQK